MKVTKLGEYFIPKKYITKDTLRQIHSSFMYEMKDGEYRSSFRIENDFLVLPRNFRKMKKIFPEIEIDDKTAYPSMMKPLVLNETFNLKPNQKSAMVKVLDSLKTREDSSVILKAPPGFGKSYTLPFVVNRVNTNTLIIVDRTGLATQMHGEFVSNCKELDLTIVSGTNREASSVTIVTFQFLIRNEEFIKRYKDFFGLVCVDECHTIGSEVFTKVVGKFNARYRLGLSATPTRSDNLTELLLDVMGQKLVNGQSDDNLNVVLLNVTHPSGKPAGNIKKYKAEYSNFIRRNSVAEPVRDIAVNFKNLNRFGLLYITEVSAQEYYARMLIQLGFRVGIINQKTPAVLRSKYIAGMEKEEIDILISGSILQKGISIKRLDYIINLSNLTKEAHEQLIGRLRRHHPTKREPLFLDFQFQGTLMWKGIERAGLSRALSTRTKDKVATISLPKLLGKIKTQGVGHKSK